MLLPYAMTFPVGITGQRDFSGCASVCSSPAMRPLTVETHMLDIPMDSVSGGWQEKSPTLPLFLPAGDSLSCAERYSAMLARGKEAGFLGKDAYICFLFRRSLLALFSWTARSDRS